MRKVLSATFTFFDRVSLVILFTVSSFLSGTSFSYGCVVPSLSEFLPSDVKKVEEEKFVKKEAWYGGRLVTIYLKEWAPRC